MAVAAPKKPSSKKRDAAAEDPAEAAKAASEGDALAAQLTEAIEHEEAAEAFCNVALAALRLSQHDMAFAISRAGVHKQGITNERLCKHYLLFLESIVKARASANRKDGPPKMLYLRELFASLPFGLSELLADQAGEDATKAGEKCVLMKERGVMVVGLSNQEWRLLLEKSGGSDRMQMISGVEEAVVRGLSQSEGTPDAQTELKNSWNAWALKLCDAEAGSSQLRSKCLLQRTVLLLQQQQHLKALESANEVLQIVPESKHAAALLATSQHKAGRKKQAAVTITDLCAAFQRTDDATMNEELGHPLELAVALLVEMHRTKDALKLLSQLLSRVLGPRQQHLFFGLARLYAKHGLNKDALVVKLPSLCNNPPDRRTWELLKSMAECTPVAVEQQLQRYIEEAGPGHFTHVPHITEVMCKLPFGAHGSAASKALHLLKRCASQVTPDRPEDLRIIVEDLRAFMSSNIPAAVSEQFPRTIESLLSSYMSALGSQHTQEAWEMPAELMKRSFNGSPPQALCDQLQTSALRIPLHREPSLWSVFRHLLPDAGSMLVRSWLLAYDPTDVARMERAATHLQQSKGEHAAALDLMRWTEAKNLQVQFAEPDRWHNLYYRVLRHTAEERAASMKRGGAFATGGLDMATPVLQAGDCPMRLSSFKFYRSQLTGLDIPLRNITSSEALILREYCGDTPPPRPVDASVRPSIGAANRPLRMLDTDAFPSWSNEAATAADIESLHAPHLLDAHEVAADERSAQQPLLSSTEEEEAQMMNGGLAYQMADSVDEDLPDVAVDASAFMADGQGAGVRGRMPLSDDLEVGAPSSELQHAGLAGLTTLDVPPSSPERQPLLAGQSDFTPMDEPRDDISSESQMFTSEQLDLAMTMLEELQLKQRVPEHLHEDDEWQRFISDLFLASGWRQLGQRYREHCDGVFSKSQLVGDVQALQASMRSQSPNADGSRPAPDFKPGEGGWLYDLLQEHVLSGPSVDDDGFEQMEPSHASDVLAYDMGQRCVWQLGFYGHDPSIGAVPFFEAPPSARSHLKLAFMHAADRLMSPRSNRTHDSPDRSGLELSGGQPHWPLVLMQQNEQIELCHKMLRTDADQALAMAQQLMEEARRLSEQDQVEVLQLVCGDACVALKQHRVAISHFSRFSQASRGSHLPLDALLEYVCAMLVEGYPAAQVTQAAEDGCLFDPQNTEGWLLLVKVLAEMIDAESAIEQAAEEENRHMVNKLLMLLGSNVTNRRERDARMQRCLQEGGDSNSERDNNGRRAGGSRRGRAEEGGAIDIQQLQLFWKALTPEQRLGLCKVPAADFEKAVASLSASVGAADRESNREGGGRATSTNSDSDAGGNNGSNPLLLMLHASLVEGVATDGEVLPAAQEVQGLRLADSLCDIKELAELVADNAETALLDPTISARGLFAMADATITLNPELFDLQPDGKADTPPAIDAEAAETALVPEEADGEPTDVGASLLERLLAVEAGFELDGAIKNRPKIEMGSQLSFQQVVHLVRTTRMLKEYAGQHLPHARWALGEMCRRLLRKEPMRAVMAAQRATMASLARLMLRGVRAAFGEEQQRLKREEAERAEQELLESLENEESKRDGNEAKKKGKKKKRRTGAADGAEVVTADSGAVDGAAEDGEEDATAANGVGIDAPNGALEQSSSNGGTQARDADADTGTSVSASVTATITQENTQPGAYAGWDAAAAIVTAARASAESASPLEALHGVATSTGEQLAAGSASAGRGMGAAAGAAAAKAAAPGSGGEEDSEAREAREAAEALAVVEAEEAAEEAARRAVIRQEQFPSENVWEEAQTKRGRRKNKGVEPTGGNAEGVDAEGAADAPAGEEAETGAENTKMRKKKSKGRVVEEQDPMAVDDDEGLVPMLVADGSSGAAIEIGLDGAPTAEEGGTPGDGPSPSSRAAAPSADGAVGGAGSTNSSKRNKRGKAPDLASAPPGACANGPSTGSTSSAGACGVVGAAAGANGLTAAGSRGKGKKGAAPVPAPDESVAIGAPAAPGLENKTGQHSCFVNVVVQTLWNVSAFRDAFLTGKLQDGASEEDSSIYIAMKEVCSMMDSAAAGDRVADPQSKQPRQATASALKEALYRLDSNFELGEMHDATEAHEALLEALHRAVAEQRERDESTSTSSPGTSTSSGNSSGSSDEGSALAGEARSGSSFVKDIFSMRMRMEYAKPADPKEEPSKPLHFDQWTQYIVASELRNAVHEAADAGRVMSPLVRVLRKEAGTEPVFDGGVAVPVTRKLNMLGPPLVFTLGLSNDSARASKLQISESLQGIEETLNLRHVYDGLGADVHCRLVALTAFYESHYVCFCFSQAAGAWIHYDDDTRRLVGAEFAQVKEKCIAGRLHPQLCFFERIRA